MHVLACPDKFRGTATGLEAAAAIGRAIRLIDPQHTVTLLPLADGGEGTLEAIAAAGGSLRRTTVTGPLGAAVEAEWLMWGSSAFIEMARASGLLLAGGRSGNDALAATTAGTGELIAAAIAEGATSITVTLGGSATTDGGLGALDALEPLSRLSRVRLTVACDVDTTFVDAARVFGPQKGASPPQVGLLSRRLEQLADRFQRERGVDVRDMPGTGAAGGLAGGLVSVGARLVSGFQCVAEVVGFEEALAAADRVITGEGFLDAESFHGKVVGSVCEAALGQEKPVLIVAGGVEEGLVEAGLPVERADLVTVVSLAEQFGLDRSMEATTACIEAAIAANW